MVAVITTGVELETENVGTLKVVLFEPAGTLTLAGYGDRAIVAGDKWILCLS